MLEPKDGEDFWIGLVEDHAKLGYSQNVIPVYCLPFETAKAVAKKLNVKLEVKDKNYVFVKKKGGEDSEGRDTLRIKSSKWF